MPSKKIDVCAKKNLTASPTRNPSVCASLFPRFRLRLGDTELSRRVAPELPPVSPLQLYGAAAVVLRLGAAGVETPRPAMPDLVPGAGLLLTSPGREALLPRDLRDILRRSTGLRSLRYFQ